MQECERVAVRAFPILAQAATPVQPSDRALNDPAPGQHHELSGVTAPHGRHVHLAADTLQTLPEFRSLIAAVGIELQQKRIQPEEAGHQQHAAVAVLDIGGMHDGCRQQALCIDKDVPLLACDLLAAVKPPPINRRPPFSAPFTLWLSMIPAVGLAWRSARSRQRT
jgi:hypothetical protein